MFVMVSKFHVRRGEEDAFVALHEVVDLRPRPASDFVSRELLADIDHPSTFVALTRYPSREAAEDHMHDPAYGDWYQRLVSLSDGAPDVSYFHMAWRTGKS